MYIDTVCAYFLDTDIFGHCPMSVSTICPKNVNCYRILSVQKMTDTDVR
ncbi:20221_t:CDS:1, partial [Racocetra persica]